MAGSKERALLGHDISHWMDSLLRGTSGARLWLKRGAKVYRIPKVDDACQFPGRPTPGVAGVAKDNSVWDLPHPFADSIPTPDWWQITGNSFPVCWVRHADVEKREDDRKVPVASSLQPAAPPQYLYKNAGKNVRTSARTHIRNAAGELASDTTNAIFKRRGPEGEFWGTKGRACI